MRVEAVARIRRDASREVDRRLDGLVSRLIAGLPERGGCHSLLHSLILRSAHVTDPHAVLHLLEQVEARDGYTARHGIRVLALAEAIAQDFASRSLRSEAFRLAALLHDLGKVGVPLEVLHKNGPLAPEEEQQMRRHVEIGARLLGDLGADVAQIVEQHHERPDGRGYPHGLSGGAICLEARIIAVADAFDAMTSDRPYRAGREPALALEELHRCDGRSANLPGQFDPEIVDALVRRLRMESTGFAFARLA